MNNQLPDILTEDLKVIFCSLLADRESLMMQHYYASPRDKFWRILQEVAFTERQIKTSIDADIRESNYDYLKSKKIGLTNLGEQATLKDVERLNNIIKEYKPKVLAFNGKKVAELYFNKSVELGEQKEKIGKTKIFVLTSTSNSASSLWNKRHWREVSNIIKK
jgi:TDG/mug DNA glycosylase family protein